ncbi:MAG: protein NLRC3-like [Rickettsiaceae bacterium]|jgi:hypothetical protein|nr:protein NLRC3-like [Rickettsiaceae bacterium]
MEDAEFKKFLEDIKSNKYPSLRLSHRNLSFEQLDAIATHLKDNTSINGLELDHSNVTDESTQVLAELLATNKYLTSIELQCNRIGDEGAKALANAITTNNVITTLELSANNIGNEGAEALAKGLATNNTLNVLYLHSNHITDPGTKALAKLFATKDTIVSFDLYCNEISENGVISLREAIRHNFTLLGDIGIRDVEIEHYTKQNKITLYEAFKHAYEYICNGNNINIVNDRLSPNPISAKDLFMLKHHKGQLRKDFDYLEKSEVYEGFYEALLSYEKKNFFKLLGICKHYSNSGSFTAIPEEKVLDIAKYISYKPYLSLTGEDTAEVDTH